MHVLARKARLALAVIAAAGLAAGTVGVPAQANTTATPTMVDIRAAHHPGYDRVVFDFSGRVPAHRSVRWVDQVIADGSGKVVKVAGHAFLQVRMAPADAHTNAGTNTVPRRITFPLPNVTQTYINGDFEGVLNVAIGLQRHTRVVRFFTLTSPYPMVVVDISTRGYDWQYRNVYYLNTDRYAAGTRPYTIGVRRPVILPRVATQAMERLFAGPTRPEKAASLRFIRSEATGFADLRIDNGIARVRLTGGCDSHGSTYTIANEIMPTLKQFPTVDHVKIYSPSGHTETPTGHVDSIPLCLEP